jgi:hypothetical protein
MLFLYNCFNSSFFVGLLIMRFDRTFFLFVSHCVALEECDQVLVYEALSCAQVLVYEALSDLEECHQAHFSA